MRIPEDVRKCVAFLEYNDNSGFHLAGTVFFVTMPSVNQPNHYFRYAVTARHIINMIEGKTIDGGVYLRLNSRDTGTDRVMSNIEDWYMHPSDDLVDVAVMPISSEKRIDWLFWPVVGFATNVAVKENEINVGDDVFLTGLFYRHTGTMRNVPIVRAGIIAAMPEEPVKTGLGETEAYLIEARSINGLSGSPVFVRPESNYGRNLKTEDPYTLGRWDGRVGSFWLLGLIHGHWNVDASDIDTIVADKADTEYINAGIGVVVPAQKIFEVIEQPRLEELRKRAEAELRKQSLPTPDSLAESTLVK
jgi:hypothetical protein